MFEARRPRISSNAVRDVRSLHANVRRLRSALAWWTTHHSANVSESTPPRERPVEIEPVTPAAVARSTSKLSSEAPATSTRGVECERRPRRPGRDSRTARSAEGASAASHGAARSHRGGARARSPSSSRAGSDDDGARNINLTAATVPPPQVTRCRVLTATWCSPNAAWSGGARSLLRGASERGLISRLAYVLLTIRSPSEHAWFPVFVLPSSTMSR